mgnify:FL=1
MDYNYGYACDIWSVGCVTFELLTGYPLFDPEKEPLNRDIHHLYLYEKILGPMPILLKKKSRRSKFLFDKKRNYHSKNIEPFEQMSIKTSLVKQFLFDEKEADEITNFLLSILQYMSNERPTAKELLQHSWLQNVDI